MAKLSLLALFLMANNALTFGQMFHNPDSSLLPLAHRITANAPNDSDKVLAICQWMCTHLTYDYQNLRNDDKGIHNPDSFQRPAVAIRRKKAICDGYAQIFRDLCLLNNIYASYIVGYTCYSELTDSAQVLHAWNSVRVNNNWYLMDLTWEDVAIDFNNSTDKKDKLSPNERIVRRLNRIAPRRLVDSLKHAYGDGQERIEMSNLINFMDSTASFAKANVASSNNINASNTPILNASSALNASKNAKNVFFAPPAKSYVFVSPNVFRTDHLPKDPLWQLTDSVISLQKFFFQHDPSVSPYFSTHFDHKKRLEELPTLDSLERQRRELSRQLQYNSRDWLVLQNIAYDYNSRVHRTFQVFNTAASADSARVLELDNLLTTAEQHLAQAEGFHKMAGKISTGYAAEEMLSNLNVCEGYRQHIAQLRVWLRTNEK